MVAGLKRPSAVIVVFAVLAAVMTWPLVTVLGVAAPGVGEDTPLFLWNIWWLQQSLVQHAGPPLWTDRLFAPEGTSLALHGLTVLPSILVLPVSVAWSPLAALGVMTLMNCTLNGATTYRLVHRLTGDRAAGWIAGIAFAYSPWALGEIQNHYNLSTLWPFILCVDGLLRMCERPDRGHALQFGLALGLMVYTDLQFLVLVVPLGLVTLATYAFGTGGGARRALLLHLGIGAAVALTIAAPLAVAAANDLARASESTAEFALAAHAHYSADLLSFVQPDQLRGGGRPVPDALHRVATPGSASQFTQVGFAIAILALIGLIEAWPAARSGHGRAGRIWVVVLPLGAVLMLGPALIVAGQTVMLGDTPAFLPSGVLAAGLPVVNIERVPTRHMLTVSLALAVLAGFGVRYLSSRFGGRWRKVVVVVGTVALIGELWPPPLPLEYANPDPYYTTLANAGPGSIVEVPFGRGTGTSQSGAYRAALLAEAAQTVHGHPIVNGYVSRGRPAAEDAVRQDPFFTYLADCTTPPPAAAVTRQSLAQTGARWVLVHLDWPTSSGKACTPAPDAVADELDRAGLLRVYADDRLIVFSRSA